ncbi:YybH family protein [Enterovibrio norvegicus]|uniref:YybH family protein n=1 Tax=Enterovibrio norvegicus TaxID=188144 RepID=UPI000C85C467|nr:nuclear transport factor 2 family protein [Enterovibrio norvegicus]PMH67370.1 DUF4440 domain-containing protein [Enterovibrio norvegicus]
MLTLLNNQFFKLTASFFLLFSSYVSASQQIWPTFQDPVAQVRSASTAFQSTFNQKDADGLGVFYAKTATLKLDQSLPAHYRSNIVEAWRAGFEQGVENLQLEIIEIKRTGFRKVVEAGNYVLTINTPNGPIEQTGTYTVGWRVHPFGVKPPNIIFDFVNAN